MSTPNNQSPQQKPDGRKNGNDLPPPAVLAAGRFSMYFAVLIIGAILTAELQLPWKIAALAFGLAAMVVGIMAMVRAVKAKMKGSIYGFLSIGLVLTLVVTLTQVWAIAIWPWQASYEECLDNAITQQAHEQCVKSYEKNLDSLIPASLMGSK
ncbi:hypothetical protein [Spelaeicoccus albus]|uniref:DUF4190 domain-containing protein n=1 Tax=Spelaeicoccus albus TaxID=1280376 RepID=A0A7Z0IJ55_9MICO|nr:hypothetical protein [Spelaeicoccus albus]NYI69169.1 hypothetical protein [Spelaeicoccus albus]